MSIRPPHALLVTSDPRLEGDLQAAFASLRDFRPPIIHLARGTDEAADAARGRLPDLVFLDLNDGADAMLGLAERIRRESPRSQVHAVYRADALESLGLDSAAVMDAVRRGIRGFLRCPISNDELAAALSDGAAPGRIGGEDEATVTSFISNKGGVGKSTLSVNVASDLATRHGERTLLIDASLQLGVCAAMLGIESPRTLLDGVNEVDRLDGTLLREIANRHSSGLHMLAAPRNAEEAAMIDEERLSRLINVARRSFDHVVIDTFPMIDNLVVSILDVSDRSFFVFQEYVPQVIGATHYLQTLRRIGIDESQLRVVVNGGHPRVAGSLRKADIESHIGRAVDFEVPYDKGVLVATNLGQPHVLGKGRRRAFGRAVRAMATDVESLRAARV